MNLMDLLQKSGGESSVERLAGSLGLGRSQAQELIASLSPSLVKSLQNQVAAPGGLDALKTALDRGSHDQYVERPEMMESDATREDGNKILGHLFGSKDVSRNVAAHASRETGIDVATIKQALPLVASLAMGALSKKSSDNRSNSLGGLLGGLLDSDKSGGVGVDDLLGLARKFF